MATKRLRGAQVSIDAGDHGSAATLQGLPPGAAAGASSAARA